MPNIGTPELILVLLVILLLFGAKRLPDTARSLGRSMRILKAETKGLRDDDAGPDAQHATTVRAEQLPPAGRPYTAAEPAAAPQVQPQSGQPPYGSPQPPPGGAAHDGAPGGAAQPPRP